MHTVSETRNLRASPDCHAPDERAHVLELVRRFGSGATSFQVLEPGYRYFFPDREACVAYIDTGRAWVAAGAPLAAEARFAGVSAAFVDAARTANRRACFFATEDRFVRRVPMRSLLMGEQPIWEPASWRPAPSATRRACGSSCVARARKVSTSVRSMAVPTQRPARRRAMRW